MKILAVLLASLCCGLAQAGNAEVNFLQPERYSDAGRGIDAEALRTSLGQHLQSLAAHGLPATQTLQVDITDIDLAGHLRHVFRTGSELRVLGGTADWPRIALHYRLREGERTLAEGDAQLADLAYLMRPLRGNPSTRYPYEQRLLTEWFESLARGQAAH